MLLSKVPLLRTPSDQYEFVLAVEAILLHADQSKPRLLVIASDFRARVESFRPTSAVAVQELYDWTVRNVLPRILGK